MEFATCDGTVYTGKKGEAICSGSWSGTTDGAELTLAELAPADIAALLGAALVAIALAFGMRALRKLMGF